METFVSIIVGCISIGILLSAPMGPVGIAQKYLPNGSCGVIAFGLKGTREDAVKFMDNLDFIAIVTHVADARTCVLHPASHTHRQLSDEQLKEAGVAPDLIRLSVGIENVEDIIADLEQAMEKM